MSRITFLLALASTAGGASGQPTDVYNSTDVLLGNLATPLFYCETVSLGGINRVATEIQFGFFGVLALDGMSLQVDVRIYANGGVGVEPDALLWGGSRAVVIVGEATTFPQPANNIVTFAVPEIEVPDVVTLAIRVGSPNPPNIAYLNTTTSVGTHLTSWTYRDNIDVWTELDASFGPRYARLTAIPGSAVTQVIIDIKPGSDPNSINLGSHGVIPVAILTTEDFDATTVDPDTVELAGSSVAIRGNGKRALASFEDVDDDGDIDLMLNVETENLSLETGATEATLTGETFDGQAIIGSDTIVIVNK